MEKIKKLLRIPALCCASAIFVVLLIALIVMSSQSCSHGTYVGKESIFGAEIKIEVNIKDNSNAVVGITTSAAGAHEYEENEEKYKVTNGEFFTSSDGGQTFNRIGKIDAYEIKVSEGGYSMTLKNEGTMAARTVMIIFMVIFAAGAIASGVYTVLSKKKESIGW